MTHGCSIDSNNHFVLQVKPDLGRCARAEPRPFLHRSAQKIVPHWTSKRSRGDAFHHWPPSNTTLGAVTLSKLTESLRCIPREIQVKLTISCSSIYTGKSSPLMLSKFSQAQVHAWVAFARVFIVCVDVAMNTLFFGINMVAWLHGTPLTFDLHFQGFNN